MTSLGLKKSYVIKMDFDLNFPKHVDEGEGNKIVIKIQV